MIRSFKGKFAAAIAEAEKGDKAPKGFPADVMNTAIRKLSIIDAAETLEDLRVPPANRLEALKGHREGQLRYGSTINGASVLFGMKMAARTVLRSSTITKQLYEPR